MRTNMHLQSLYTIYDDATQTFQPPVMFENNNVAIRWMHRCMQEVPMMKQSPRDFHLYDIGTFNLQTAETTKQLPLKVISGLNCVKPITEEEPDETTKVSNDAPILSRS